MANRFSDFAAPNAVMDGDKIKIEDILNREIEVTAFKIMDSQYKKNEKCLKLQFVLEGEKRVLFTGSNVLIDQCITYSDKMPFMAAIKKIDKYFSFT